jgi:hypothetical protein
MAAPTSYTEATLAEYILAILGPVAAALGWAEQADVQETLNEALLAYGVADIADADDIAKLRALARREAWRAAAAATAGDYDFEADGGRYNRSQVHAQALAAFQAAMVDAMPYDPDYAVSVDAIVHIHDPYTVLDDEERTLP